MNARDTYDVIVVGAGPAGLSAARTAARLGFSTLVLERLDRAGDLSHPCSAIIAPVPHNALAQGSTELYFRKIDLAIPQSLVLGYPAQQHWLAPDGADHTTALGVGPGQKAAVIDKRGLLQLLAGQASQAGADLRFGSEVTGLLRSGGSITGVQTATTEYEGRMVLAAEGTSQILCDTALPRAQGHGRRPPVRYGFVASQELIAPGVRAENVGQFVTLGRRYTSAREGFGMALVPTPGRLSVYFTLFADGPHHYTERSAHYYIQEYMQEDPRVRDLCLGARAVSEQVSSVRLATAPRQVVTNGFIGVGDAVTPGGYLGILPAIYLGRQAALVAGEAIDADDTSARRLAFYEAFFRKRILPGLDTEAHLLTTLGQMPDDEIGAFCTQIEGRHGALPFSAHTHALNWETAGSLNGSGRRVRPHWDWTHMSHSLQLAWSTGMS